jgi:hypothetical protein
VGAIAGVRFSVSEVYELSEPEKGGVLYQWVSSQQNHYVHARAFPMQLLSLYLLGVGGVAGWRREL